MKNLLGQLKRCERKLADEFKRGKRHCPHYMFGQSFNRRKFHHTMHQWANLSGKWNRIACKIYKLTGEYPNMPKECGGA